MLGQWVVTVSSRCSGVVMVKRALGRAQNVVNNGLVSKNPGGRFCRVDDGCCALFVTPLHALGEPSWRRQARLPRAVRAESLFEDKTTVLLH